MKYYTQDGKEFTSLEKAREHSRKLNEELYDGENTPHKETVKNTVTAPVPYRMVINTKKVEKVKKERKVYDSTLPKKYVSYLKRSNVKKLPFELTVEQFDNILSLSCVYCGSDSRIIIDRIDSKEGYVLDNCQPCCFRCNMMKFTTSHKEFLQQVKKIYEYKRGC